MTPDAVAAFSLLNAEAVRTRAQHLLVLGLEGKLPHFHVDLSRLDAAADLVLDVTRKAHPTLDMPFHSRWRHFVRHGKDRWAAIDNQISWPNKAARARAAFESRLPATERDRPPIGALVCLPSAICSSGCSHSRTA